MLPWVGKVGLPPIAQKPATGISVRPMAVMTIPATSGGKKRMTREKYGAIRRPRNEATITAPENRRDAPLPRDGDHRRHAGKRDALHQRQLAAEVGQPHRLKDGRYPAGKERGGDQQADLARIEAGRLADDQRNGDDAAIHRQDVLKAIGNIRGDSEPCIFGSTGLHRGAVVRLQGRHCRSLGMCPVCGADLPSVPQK